MKKKCITSAVCFGLFLLLILLIKTVDVAAVGPEGTEIGLSKLNVAVHNLFGENLGWYKVTNVLASPRDPVGCQCQADRISGVLESVKGKAWTNRLSV